MVFYRKYRPQTIDQLDSNDVRSFLSNIFNNKTKKVAHAFLFVGSQGTGKTSAARIVSKILNCEHLKKTSSEIPHYEPCNACDQCKAITNGTHMDVYEIDGASNRGIDEIRDLREKINLVPSMGKNKVYIIDEVHMLTREAFNALLKTLEEPPPHVHFILATTEKHKVPDTILSRCVVIPFKKATQEEILRSLKRVIAGENIKKTDKELIYIAESSDGSFRDAVKLLESQDSWLVKAARRHLYKSKIVTCLLKKDLKKALDQIEQMSQDGTDFLVSIQVVLEEFHKKLLANPSDVEVKRIIRLLMRAWAETKTASIPQLPLEMAVIEYCSE